MNELPIMTESNNYINCVENQNIATSNPACDIEESIQGASSGLDKLQLITDVDFHSDQYARYSIHETEIKDYVRTNAYRDCIECCAQNYIKDKIVLVIRCGIGLLPMLCIQNGHAKKVIALEQSACIDYARQVIHDNSYDKKITLIQSNIRDLKELPHGFSQVDVIVSDFMGDCVINQSDLMEQVIEARDRFLKPNGLMIPKCVTLYGQLLEQMYTYENQRICKNKNKDNTKSINKTKLDGKLSEESDSSSTSDSTNCSWWSNVYGFDMRSKREYIVDSKKNSSGKYEKWCVMPEPIVTGFNSRKVVSYACLMKTFDMHKCTIADTRHVECKDLTFKCFVNYSKITGTGYGHMLELFMVVDFPNGETTGGNKIGFSTSSYNSFTRYKQTGLLLRDQLLVENTNEFIINEFYMWRGPQENGNNELFERITAGKSPCDKIKYDQNLKLRLSYTFVNQHMKVFNRRCVYCLTNRLI